MGHGHKLAIIVVAVIMANLLALNLKVFTQTVPVVTKHEIIKIVESVIPGKQADETDCGPRCEEMIRNATASATAQDSSTSGSTSGTSREAFITIGTGSFSSEYDWGDVPGAQVSVDGSSYGTIKTAVFEATVNTPDGAEDVSVRLYNQTDNRPVWNSDLFFPSGSATRFLVSAPISLEPGSKVYKVQMKTQFATHAKLDLARIHIH
jgi:hypothetical protein